MLIMVLKLCTHCHLRVFKFKTCNTKVTITLTVTVSDIVFICDSNNFVSKCLRFFPIKMCLIFDRKK